MKDFHYSNTAIGKPGSVISEALLPWLALNKSDHLWGDKDAKVMLVVYEDYECESCSKSFRELRALCDYFKEEICMVFRHFPFTQKHPSAFQAALVVEACALQHKFQQARDLIFEYQQLLEYGLGGILRLLKKKYSISIEQLNEDLKRKDLKKRINDDIESGKRCGVQNTPAIFINDYKYAEAIKFDKMSEAIRKIISRINFDLRNKNDSFLEQKYLLEGYA